MSWRDEISAGLQPSPTPPEGSDAAQVRRDIIDELADHLECAMRRELRKTDDETVARRAVLKKFGDPTRIACRLWFDAMKESIMSQRISLITNIVLAVACITVCVFALLAIQRNTQMAEAMLAKMKAIGAETKTSAASEIWAEATATVHWGAADGETIEGFEVAITGQPFNPGEPRALSERTDASGDVSFGPIRPGEYLLQYHNQGVQFRRTVVLYPGRNELEPIVWPMPPEAKPTEISFDLTMPEELREQVGYLMCSFSKTPCSGEPDQETGTWDRGYDVVILTPDGRAMLLSDDNWPFGDRRESWNSPLYLDRIRLEEQLKLDSSFIYRLRSIEALPPMLPSDAERGEYAKVRAGFKDSGTDSWSSWPTERELHMRSGGLARMGQEWLTELHAFQATSEGPNVWRLEIPDWFAQFAIDGLQFVTRQHRNAQR